MVSDMKIVAVVPIKLNNVRCPHKNISPLGKGKPLCRYILDTLQAVEQIDDIYVYCSDEEIKKYIPDGVKYLKRAKWLDADTTKMNEILKNFAEEVNADIYVMTHATSPFVKPKSIEKGIQKVCGGDYDSSFAAKKIQDFLWKNGKPLNYRLNDIPRTQDLEPILQETSGFYIFRKHVICRMNRRIGDKPYIVEVDELEGIDIDEPADFRIASAVADSFWNSDGEDRCGG